MTDTRDFDGEIRALEKQRLTAEIERLKAERSAMNGETNNEH